MATIGVSRRLTDYFTERCAGATVRHRRSVRSWQRKEDRFYRQVQLAVAGGDVAGEALEVAQDLEELMCPLPEQVTVWRGVRDVEAVFGISNTRLELLVGTEYAVPKFFATSLSRRVAKDEFTVPGVTPALLELVAKAGVPALWVPVLGEKVNAYQQELLFPPRTIMRILQVSRPRGLVAVEGEICHG